MIYIEELEGVNKLCDFTQYIILYRAAVSPPPNDPYNEVHG